MIIIGSDESLKGDTFGGIVICSLRADDILRKKLVSIGVVDSKKMKDKKIIEMANMIKDIVGSSNYCVRSKMPSEYNLIGKQTEILNKMHKQAILMLRPESADKVIVDQYPGIKIFGVGACFETKAEDKYVEVAAASIIARSEAVKQMTLLSDELGFDIPYGSTHVKEALAKLKIMGKNPNNYVKTHFRNVKVIFSGL
jgi:ribonuclease HIII